jgi:hypothetical protein
MPEGERNLGQGQGWLTVPNHKQIKKLIYLLMIGNSKSILSLNQISISSCRCLHCVLVSLRFTSQWVFIFVSDRKLSVNPLLDPDFHRLLSLSPLRELIEIWFKERIDLEFPIISKYKLTKAQRGQRQQLIEI